jgi:hypothetical protein
LGSSIMQTAERGGRNLLSCSGVLPSARHFAGRWQMTKGGPAGAAGTAAPEKLAIERQRSVACRLRSTEKASVCVREFCSAAFWTLCDVGGGTPGADGQSGKGGLSGKGGQPGCVQVCGVCSHYFNSNHLLLLSVCFHQKDN